jgi:phosphohistidine phosphatase
VNDMRLYIVRHAIAQERDRQRWPDDAKRPLTADGRRRFLKAATGLAGVLPRNAALLTSPFVRAWQTAELLADAAKLKKARHVDELAAGQPLHKIFDLLRARREQDVIVVGHEPDLGRLLGAAVAGQGAKLGVEFKKGGAACVQFQGPAAPGRGVLLWMLPPRVLRAMG